LDNAHRDPLLAHIAIGFLNAGTVDLADRALDAVTDKTQIATVVLAFARDHWRKEEKDEAVEALEEALAILRSQHENETRDSRSKFILMGTIAAQFAGFGRRERAIEAADSIPDARQRMNALTQICAICIQQGDEPLARETLEILGDRSDRTAALVHMSEAAAELDPELSETLLRDAETSAEDVELLGPKAEAVLAIAERHLKAGRTANARSAVFRIFSIVGEMRDDAARVGVLARAAEIIELGEIELSEDDLAGFRSLLGSGNAWNGR
jgi:hypothetical protein